MSCNQDIASADLPKVLDFVGSGKPKFGGASWLQNFLWFSVQALFLRSESFTSSIRFGDQI